MLTLRQVIPPLTVRTPNGDTIRAWDYKQKNSLLIAFLHGECPVCARFASRLVSKKVELAEAEAVALLVALDKPSWGIDSQREIIPGVDTAGRAAEEYLGLNAMGSRGLSRVGVFVSDRYGELFAQWEAWDADNLPPLPEIFKWLTYTQIVCEECSVPLWRMPER